jgi:isoquinoline 1-oxidoreductase subunit beta
MLNRRAFLRVSTAAAGGMVVSMYFDRPSYAQQPPAPAFPPDAFVHVRPDGPVVIQVNRLECGQGIQTALPMILADEMDADWSQVLAELAPADDLYKDPIFGVQMTGGSAAVANSFQQYRELGAKTRAMLIAAAAARWQVSPDECRAAKSVVYGPKNRSVRYADLAADAARQPIPAKVTLKDPTAFTLIGTRTRRLDSRAKCEGAVKFGLDLDVPQMQIALLARPPMFGGRVKRFDDTGARGLAGVRDVFEIPIAHGTAVAVVADTFWTAKQARDRLTVDWDMAGLERVDSGRLRSTYQALARTTGNIAVRRGEDDALERIPVSRRIVADFEFPYLPHTPMEPENATIRFDGDRAEAWVPTQAQTEDQVAIADVLGLRPQQVTFHTEYAGGGFGRRSPFDCHIVREAAAIAKRLRGTPVKLVWTREDDVQGGYYRPVYVHHVELGVDEQGMPAAWKHVIVGQSWVIGSGHWSEPFVTKDGVDILGTQGTTDTRYRIPNFHVSAHHPTVNVPVTQLRSIGYTHNTFVMETLIDELATRAKIDPIAYRLKLLEPNAMTIRAALMLLEEKSAAWRRSLAPGHAVGIACNDDQATGVACAVDVSIENNRPRIHRATVAINVGLAVNPLSVEAQCQGGLIFGLSQLVAKGAITINDGRVEQRNFDGVPPPYMKDAPVAIDVHIVPSAEKPSGCGEPPVPVISPAVVNALFRLTGKRYRTLPLISL